MPAWTSDEELFEIARGLLFSAVVGDIMDKLGLQHQFLPPQVRPLTDSMVVIGRSMPVLETDTIPDGSGDSTRPGPLGRSFGLMLDALDGLKPNEVYVCSGASPTYALWGELMSVRATYLKAAGAVMNGYSRDTKGIIQLGFPCFSYGSYAQDQAPRGKVIDYRTPIRFGDVTIRPGDIIFGDYDGVCVVPREAEVEVFTRAIEKAQGEKTVMQALQSGMSAAQAFGTYGIL
jgi:regulator of RNase E activity RraA